MPSPSLPRVAYFCMEYALHSDFKMYAGGLGILAGDYMKGAKDHRFPDRWYWHQMETRIYGSANHTGREST